MATHTGSHSQEKIDFRLNVVQAVLDAFLHGLVGGFAQFRLEISDGDLVTGHVVENTHVAIARCQNKPRSGIEANGCDRF